MLGFRAAQQRRFAGSRGHSFRKPARLLSCLAPIALAMAALSGPAAATGVLQCVPFARAMSGINIHGDAATWWGQAEHQFDRGLRPRIGAVLAFKATAMMPRGHVAVVDAIIDERHILLDHANWSQPGLIEQGVMAVDTSPAGDWSEVRVWYAPVHGLGSRESPAYGFIYTPTFAASSRTGRSMSAFERAFATMDATPATPSETRLAQSDYTAETVADFAATDERPVPQIRPASEHSPG